MLTNESADDIISKLSQMTNDCKTSKDLKWLLKSFKKLLTKQNQHGRMIKLSLISDAKRTLIIEQ